MRGRLVILSAILTLLVLGMGPGQAGAELPPLLDRELFFGDPEISAAQLSPDGHWMAFLKPYDGARNIWIKSTEEPFGDARPLTADDRPVPGYFWSRDSQYVLYVQDNEGDENYHVWAVNPEDAPEAETGVPDARNLTPVEGVRARIFSVPKNAPEVIIVGVNDRDPRFHDIYAVEIATGERRLIQENDDGMGNWIFDLDGKLRLATRQTPTGGTELLRVDMDGYTRLAESTYEETLYVLQFRPDGEHAYAVSNMGPDVDLSRLMLMDGLTGDMELVETDPEGEVDFGGASFHPQTDELMATYYTGDRMRVYPKTPEASELWDNLRSALPSGEIQPTSLADDLSMVLIAVYSDVDPGSVYLYHRGADRAELQYRSRPDLPSEHLGGRYQEDVRPETEERLDEISVDVGTVSAEPRADR